MDNNSQLEIEAEGEGGFGAERQGYLQLIKTLQENMRELHEEFQKKTLAFEKLNAELVRAHDKKLQAKIEQIEASTASYERATVEQAQHLAEKLNNAIGELHRAFHLQAAELEARFDKLSGRYFGDLDQINKTYERVRAAYEALQVSAQESSHLDSLAALENKARGLQRQLGELNSRLELGQEEHEEKMAQLRQWLGDNFIKFQAQFRSELEELNMNQSELHGFVRSIDETLNARMNQLWLGLILSALISLAAIILSRF